MGVNEELKGKSPKVFIITKGRSTKAAEWFTTLLLSGIDVTTIDIDKGEVPTKWMKMIEEGRFEAGEPPFLLLTGMGLTEEYVGMFSHPVSYFIKEYLPSYIDRCDKWIDHQKEVRDSNPGLEAKPGDLEKYYPVDRLITQILNNSDIPSSGEIRAIDSNKLQPKENIDSRDEKEILRILENKDNEVRVNVKKTLPPRCLLYYCEIEHLPKFLPELDNFSLHILLAQFEKGEQFEKCALVAAELKIRGILNDYSAYNTEFLKIKDW